MRTIADLRQLDLDALTADDLEKVDVNSLDPDIAPERFAKFFSFAVVGAGDEATAKFFDRISSTGFVKLISPNFAEQLDRALEREDVRDSFLDEIFRRMQDQFRPERAKKYRSAVIHWKISGPDSTAGKRYEMRINEGRCDVSDSVEHEPTLTLAMPVRRFLDIISGHANPVLLYMTGKLKAKGDFGLAAKLSKLFEFPK